MLFGRPLAAGGGGFGSADWGRAAGAEGAAWPSATEIPNRRHCPSTGANASSKLTCLGTEGKKPAMRIIPLASICGSTVSCGSITATPERSRLSRRWPAKISASRAAVLTWKAGAPRSRSTV